MAEYFRVLKYPLLFWFLLDTAGISLTALVPGYGVIQDSWASGAVWALPFGAWAAYKMIQFKGNAFHAMVAGVITGAWCGIMAVTETGITSVPVAVITTPAGVVALGGNMAGLLPFGFAFFIINVVGAVIGTGFALTRGPTR